MASLREIRGKIKSVKSTQQITKAMKMVAAARMRRAASAILASRPFALKIAETVRQLALVEMGVGKEQVHPFFQRRVSDKAGLILVTADKGLCGAFNTNVLRAALDWLRRNNGKRVSIALVGRKGRDFVQRLKDVPLETMIELSGIFPKASFAHAELLGSPVISAYLERRLSSVTVIYNEFKSAVQQRVVETQLLPIPMPENKESSSPADSFDFKFEPSRDILLQALLPRYVKAQLYRILLESQAAELAARMNAMDAASKNAKELIEGLTLGLNRTRQAMITREIAELVGGAEALAS